MGFWKHFLAIIFGPLVITSCVKALGELSAKNCGRQIVRGPKIIGGEYAYEGEFPWLVSIKEEGVHFCAGLIIANRLVMTANHCFDGFSNRFLDMPQTIQVTLGEFNLRNSTTSPNVRNVSVRKILRHPDWNENNFENDIAILRLNENIEWSDYISPICLPERKYFYTSHQKEEMGFVAGWGKTQEQTRTESRSWSRENMLKKVNLTIYENSECQKMFRKKRITQNITAGHICAGYAPGGLDSCQGDSGGGLMVRINNRWTAIGIVSAGKGCALEGMPSLYTRVSNYLNFIAHTTSLKTVSNVNNSIEPHAGSFIINPTPIVDIML